MHLVNGRFASMIFPFATAPKAFKLIRPFSSYVAMSLGLFQKKMPIEVMFITGSTDLGITLYQKYVIFAGAKIGIVQHNGI